MNGGEVMKENDFDITLYALRYALGRHTYVCSEVADYIKEQKLHDEQAEALCKELDRYFNDDVAQSKEHKTDTEIWVSLYKWLGGNHNE